MVILPLRVLAYETDYGGVVSNTRYVEYLERGRYALVHGAGLTVTQIWDEHGVQPVVRRTEIDYLDTARHEDELELRVWTHEHTRATSVLRFELTRERDGAVLMRARQTLAYINTRWKPVRVPEIYRAAMPVDEPQPCKQ